MSCYIHCVPGRLRIRASAFKHNQDEADAARALLTALPGVASAQPNLLTGSILVTFDPSLIGEEAILETLRDRGLIGRGDASSGARPAGVPLSRLGRKAGMAAANALLEKALERTALALVAALV